MNRGVSGHAFDGPGEINDTLGIIIVLICLDQIGRYFQSPVDSNSQLSRHHFSDAIHIPIRNVQNPSHITDSGPGGHGSKSNDLGPHDLHHIFQ
jgi:hypothetical protein